MKVTMSYRNNKGIALIVAIGTLMLIFIVAALAIYLVTRSMNITAGQKRYQSAFEACEGGVEIGTHQANVDFNAHVLTENYKTEQVGKYRVHVYVKPLFAATEAGAVIKFARGYFGAGQGLASGGASYYYKIVGASHGAVGDSVTMETEIKKVIGID